MAGEADVLFTSGVLFVTFLVALIVIMLALHMARSRAKHPRREPLEKSEPGHDRAYNALITTEAISRELEEKGVESVKAEETLRSARQAYFEGRMSEAEELSTEARALLTEVQVVQEPHEPIPVLEETEIPESKPVLGKDYPKNYIQAKFFLGVVKDSLKRTRKRSGEVKRARDMMKEADQAFAEERYDDALSVAVNSDRLLRGEDITKQVAAPRVGSGDGYCPGCQTEVSLDDVFCGKCGYRLVRTECPECRREVAEDDDFCRRCGADLGPLKEATARLS